MNFKEEYGVDVTGWYAHDLMVNNMDDFEPLLLSGMLARVNIIKAIRKDYFPDQECNELAKHLSENSQDKDEILRLSTAVFTEEVNEDILGYLEKVKKECEGLSNKRIAKYLKYIVQDAWALTVKQMSRQSLPDVKVVFVDDSDFIDEVMSKAQSVEDMLDRLERTAELGVYDEDFQREISNYAKEIKEEIKSNTNIANDTKMYLTKLINSLFNYTAANLRET